VALLIAFPILWTLLTSFKPEPQAVASPPVWFAFDWTLKNYFDVQKQRDYFDYFQNSVIISLGSTALGLVIAIPAAWSMAFVPGRRTKDLLMWMLSTKMMPGVAVLIPIYLIFIQFGLLDSRLGLVVVLTLINLPDHRLDALHLLPRDPWRDPRGRANGRRHALGRGGQCPFPMALPGIATHFLLNVILAWNEAVLDHRAYHHRMQAPRSPSVISGFSSHRASATQLSAGLGHGHSSHPHHGLVRAEVSSCGGCTVRRVK
jgi:sorbitol/mannitol transport system permease protein